MQLRQYGYARLVAYCTWTPYFILLQCHTKVAQKVDVQAHKQQFSCYWKDFLIKLVDFILANLDKSKAIAICLIDFSKAYNRQCHNRLLTCYSDLGTPPYLLKVVKSYLMNRKMAVRHKGKISKFYEIPGGGAQGTNMGILSFFDLH